MSFVYLIIERVLELLVAALFAYGSVWLGAHAAQSWVSAYVTAGEHLEVVIPAFLLLLVIYLTVFGLLVRYCVFVARGERKLCGLYAQIFFRDEGQLIVSPYLVLFDILRDEIKVAGRAFLIDPASDPVLRYAAWWNSVAAYVERREDADHVEMSYLFLGNRIGQGASDSLIKGVTRFAVPGDPAEDHAPRVGYICDTQIHGSEIGRIKDVSDSITAFRTLSVRFDQASFEKFIELAPGEMRQFTIRHLRVFRNVPPKVFEQFLCSAGLSFLAHYALDADASWLAAKKILGEAAARCRVDGASAIESGRA